MSSCEREKWVNGFRFLLLFHKIFLKGRISVRVNSRIHFSRFNNFFSSRRQDIRFTFIILEEGTCHAIVWAFLNGALDGNFGCVVSNFISFFSFVIFDRPISKYFFTKINFKRTPKFDLVWKNVDAILEIYRDNENIPSSQIFVSPSH